MLPTLITHDGKTMSVRAWAKHFGIFHTTFRHRLITLGMPIEAAGSLGPIRKSVSKYAYKQVRTVVNGRITTPLVHVLIAEKALGRRLPEGAQVHHVDCDPKNNAPINLVICPGAAYHKLLHRRQRAYDACGNPEFRKCQYCKKHDNPTKLYISPNGRTVHHRDCLREHRRNK